MTSGGWYIQEQRHGRHRRGATGAAWTPAVRPADAGPAHARHDGTPAFRPTEMAARPAWPAPRHRAPEWPKAGTPLPTSRGHADGARRPLGFLREPIVPAPLRRTRHAATPVPADMLADTVPMSPPPKHSKVDTGPLSSAIEYALPETPATGLRKFDLGTVPASVTPPRSWRKAAWFAVGTSAAVVLGLSIATSELMGRPVNDGALIDALPAYPTGPLTMAQLPHETTSSDEPDTDRPTTSRPRSSTTVPPSTEDSGRPRDTVIGSTTGEESVAPTEPPSEDTTTTPREPTRTTVGAAPVVAATDPAKMGERTEEYFRLVTTDPAAAHAMTTGGMAREGAHGIEARYGGVERVEVQDITIDRNQAVTTSRVKVVHKDGTETLEERRLTFTWGGNPKITQDAPTE